jgi:hypothetical protein
LQPGTPLEHTKAGQLLILSSNDGGSLGEVSIVMVMLVGDGKENRQGWGRKREQGREREREQGGVQGSMGFLDLDERVRSARTNMTVMGDGRG